MTPTKEEIIEEIEQFRNDNSTDEEFYDVLSDYVIQVADEGNRSGYADRVKSVMKLADEVEFTIKVHEAMACAVGEVPANLLPEGDLERLVLKMAPKVANWLLEDYNVSEKE